MYANIEQCMDRQEAVLQNAFSKEQAEAQDIQQQDIQQQDCCRQTGSSATGHAQ